MNVIDDLDVFFEAVVEMLQEQGIKKEVTLEILAHQMQKYVFTGFVNVEQFS